MRLGSKNPDPEVQWEHSHREQCKRAGAFGASLYRAQALIVDKISDHEGWQRCNREEKEAVEIENEVYEVIAPWFRSV